LTTGAVPVLYLPSIKQYGDGAMNYTRKSAILLLNLAVFIFATCGSTAEREQNILNQYSERNNEKYADLLVDTLRYTTSGAEYHKKFYRYLIGIAGDIVEKKNLAVEKGSLGFYYDKKSGDRDKLYLGLDLDTKSTFEQPFDTVAVSLVRKNLKDVIQTINSCRSIFSESGIVGMVIGWVWTSKGAREHVSVWIYKEDFIRFEDGMITFDELLLRSTVTNTIGRVFKLPL
jgi:hypothetical protein